MRFPQKYSTFPWFYWKDRFIIQRWIYQLFPVQTVWIMYIPVSLLQCGQDCHCQQVTLSLPAFTECACESSLQSLYIADSVTDAVSVRAFWISPKSCYWLLLCLICTSWCIMIQSLCAVPRARPVRLITRRQWRESLTSGAKTAPELSVGSALGSRACQNKSAPAHDLSGTQRCSPH